jgi:hypothetical protein
VEVQPHIQQVKVVLVASVADHLGQGVLVAVPQVLSVVMAVAVAEALHLVPILGMPVALAVAG